jgi:hypothetical protein
MPATKTARILRAAVLALVAANLLFYGFFVALEAWPGLEVLWHSVRYTAGHCSRWKVIADSRERRRGDQIARRVQSESRRIRQDAVYTQWETPRGRFWIPTDTDVLPALLAQHETHA